MPGMTISRCRYASPWASPTCAAALGAEGGVRSRPAAAVQLFRRDKKDAPGRPVHVAHEGETARRVLGPAGGLVLDLLAVRGALRATDHLDGDELVRVLEEGPSGAWVARSGSPKLSCASPLRVMDENQSRRSSAISGVRETLDWLWRPLAKWDRLLVHIEILRAGAPGCRYRTP